MTRICCGGCRSRLRDEMIEDFVVNALECLHDGDGLNEAPDSVEMATLIEQAVTRAVGRV